MDPLDTNPALVHGVHSESDPFTDQSHSHSHSEDSSSRLSSVAQNLPSPGAHKAGSLLSQLLSLPFDSQAIAVFALFEFFLGASLWVDGQAGGSISVTGLGYLVVFDALGVMSIVAHQLMLAGGISVSSLRNPFGYVLRLLSLAPSAF